jgi:hypothetical protein
MRRIHQIESDGDIAGQLVQEGARVVSAGRLVDDLEDVGDFRFLTGRGVGRSGPGSSSAGADAVDLQQRGATDDGHGFELRLDLLAPACA